MATLNFHEGNFRVIIPQTAPQYNSHIIHTPLRILSPLKVILAVKRKRGDKVITDILQIIAAIALPAAFLSMSFRFVKPRGNQADFILLRRKPRPFKGGDECVRMRR
jgi:hypothetical protein